MQISSALFYFGFTLLFLGIVILAVAAILLVPRSRKGKVKTAGVILVGPVPIIFGSDKKWVVTILILAIIFTALIVAAMFIYYLLHR